jgi:hypothetical protein
MKKKVKMKLVGLNGNAFVLMGTFANKAKEQGWTQDDVDGVMNECMSSDYNHLLATLSRNIDGGGF